jgi:hypothetical protein
MCSLESLLGGEEGGGELRSRVGQSPEESGLAWGQMSSFASSGHSFCSHPVRGEKRGGERGGPGAGR